MIEGNVLDGLLAEARPDPEYERKHKERPRCDICGKEVREDLWDILGFIICDYCIDDARRDSDRYIIGD